MKHPCCFLLLASGLILAGCGTTTRQDTGRIADWQHGDRNGSTSGRLSSWSAPSGGSVKSAGGISAAAAAPSTTTAPRTNGSTWVSVSGWCAEREFAPPLRLPSTTPASFAIRTRTGDFIFRPGSQRAFWNGVELGLGFAPQLVAAGPVLHGLDMEKTLGPLMQKGDEYEKVRPLVVLDPGHGGPDCGAESVLGGACEKTYALDWARRTRNLLVAEGWRVLLTRDGDVEMSLSNRVQFAEANGADFFVSLHLNSAPGDSRQEGLETYCLSPAGMPSHLTRGYGDDVRSVFPNNAFDGANVRLAERVHRELLVVNSNRDRGIRRARFLGVLRGQQRPAILVEGGYLSNPREARLIADAAYRQKMAEALANALLGGTARIEQSADRRANEDPEASAGR